MQSGLSTFTVTNRNKKNSSKKVEGKGKEYITRTDPANALIEQTIKNAYVEQLNNKILDKLNQSSPEDFVNSNS